MTIKKQQYLKMRLKKKKKTSFQEQIQNLLPPRQKILTWVTWKSCFAFLDFTIFLLILYIKQ